VEDGSGRDGIRGPTGGFPGLRCDFDSVRYGCCYDFHARAPVA